MPSTLWSAAMLCLGTMLYSEMASRSVFAIADTVARQPSETVSTLEPAQSCWDPFRSAMMLPSAQTPLSSQMFPLDMLLSEFQLASDPVSCGLSSVELPGLWR